MPSEISKTFFKKVIKYESWYNIYALSEEDARGLGQIIESSWNKVETKIPYEPGVYNPAKNLEVSMKILKNIYSTNRRLNPYWKTADAEKRKEYLLTCYNWGSKNLKEKGWNLKKAPKKTKKYIDNVLGK